MTIDGQCVKRKRIWVICEGKHESGGALLNLIHRILPSSVESEIVFEPWKNPRNSGRRFRSSGKGDGVLSAFEDFRNDAAVYIGQSKISALKTVG